MLLLFKKKNINNTAVKQKGVGKASEPWADTHIFVSGNFRSGKVSVETSKTHNGPHRKEADHCLYDSA